MISASDIYGLIDHISRKVAGQYPEHGAHIAHIGSEIRLFLETVIFADQKNALTGPAELFDICHALETDPALEPHPDIAEAIVRHRAVAANVMLCAHYTEEQKNGPEKTRALLREQILAGALLEFLPALRKALPEGRFGPGTLREIATPEWMETVEEQIYALETDSEQWEIFQGLLPSALRERFDPSENGIEMPDHLTSVAEAMDLLHRTSERRRIPMLTLLDPAPFVRHCKEIHGFSMVMEFLARQPKAGPEPATPGDTSSPASPSS